MYIIKWWSWFTASMTERSIVERLQFNNTYYIVFNTNNTQIRYNAERLVSVFREPNPGLQRRRHLEHRCTIRSTTEVEKVMSY